MKTRGGCRSRRQGTGGRGALWAGVGRRAQRESLPHVVRPAHYRTPRGLGSRIATAAAWTPNSEGAARVGGPYAMSSREERR